MLCLYTLHTDAGCTVNFEIVSGLCKANQQFKNYSVHITCSAILRHTSLTSDTNAKFVWCRPTQPWSHASMWVRFDKWLQAGSPQPVNPVVQVLFIWISVCSNLLPHMCDGHAKHVLHNLHHSSHLASAPCMQACSASIWTNAKAVHTYKSRQWGQTRVTSGVPRKICRWARSVQSILPSALTRESQWKLSEKPLLWSLRVLTSAAPFRTLLDLNRSSTFGEPAMASRSDNSCRSSGPWKP